MSASSDRLRLPAELASIDAVVLEALDNAQIGLMVTLDDGDELMMIYASERLAQIIGYDRDSLLQRPVLANVAPEELAQMSALRDAFYRRESTPPIFETVVLRKSGERIAIELGTSAIETEAGVVTISFVRDISERRRLRHRVALADRMATVGTVAAGIAHEVNNPLTYVMLNLDRATRTLRKTEQPAEPTRTAVLDALGDAREGVLRVRDIVADLRAFARPVEDAREVNVVKVLQSVVRIARREILDRAGLDEDLQPVPPVQASEGRLGQVFLNLLMNAVQAIPSGEIDHHWIKVSTRVERERIVVAVADSGIGMTEDVLRRSFDPFFTTKPMSVGTGLGLSICHRIVTSLGGEIEAESKPGAGSTFRVFLPHS